jgi:hypothetical protein
MASMFDITSGRFLRNGNSSLGQRDRWNSPAR